MIRPQSDEWHDFRGFSRPRGRRCFQALAMPSSCCLGGFHRRSRRSTPLTVQLEEACSPLSVTLLLEDEIDISRGDMIVKADNAAAGRSGHRGHDLLV